MKIACLTAYPPAIIAGPRYRLGQYAAALSRHGIAVDMIPFASARLQSVLYEPGKRLVKMGALLESLARWLPRLARTADLFFVQREAALIGPPIIERWLSRRYPMVYDFDDAIFLATDSVANGRLARWARPANKTIKLVQMSHAVLAGNDYLATFARQHATNVHVIPTTVDCELVRPRQTFVQAKIPTIGWIGSHSTAVYLERIVPALQQLARTYRFRLLIVGAGRPITIDSIECINLPWEAQRETSDFQSLDIGIYPLPETEWSLGKCGLKAIQYGAVGIPCVCTPIGVNREIVRDGQTGFLASSQAEWVTGLSQLLDDADLRKRMGAAAREHILAEYALDRHSERLISIMKDTVCAVSAGS
jgi:glycosyltransferase involved in cell wall biosynthesis